ncbi:isoprenylcysteine carboxylmethyltransferase family protein [Desulforamulus aquiferis]|uniref:Isoprenylcysteine carboxylmethyltransferase family protein n=1 Tax=Desulforamulus aquiferis TaxID=1397668 RepID=A0AAW7ZHT5_9FIRM|nr:isoprenylcysteine carboxylmethyltransferase family protein [Desulforamulus aquiferis]
MFLSLFLVCLIIRTGYELLKKSGKVNTGSMIFFAIIFVVMFILWMSWFNMCPQDPIQIILPDVLRWISFSLTMIGFGLALGTVYQLRGLENINHLVTTGLFLKFRHPMYTGFILWIIGWAVYHSAIISLVAGLFGIGNILYWRQLEEDELESRYGEVYREYRKGTWF